VSKAWIACLKRFQSTTNDLLHLCDAKAALELFLRTFRARKGQSPASSHECAHDQDGD
jgi:hypothetical protein